MGTSSGNSEDKDVKSKKSSETEMDARDESDHELITVVDDHEPDGTTKSKETSANQDGDDNDTGENEEASTPKVKGRNSSKSVAKSGKSVSKSKKGKRTPAPKKVKKDDNSVDDGNKTVENGAKAGDEVKEEKVPVKGIRNPIRRGRKRKVEESEKVVDNSIMDEVQNITKDLTESDEKEAEDSPPPKKIAKEKKPPKVNKQAQKLNVSSDDVIEITKGLPEGWVKKLVIRKSGKTAGRIDMYVYSPDGKKFRSKPGIMAYLEDTKSKLKISEFDLSKNVEGKNLPHSKANADAASEKVDKKKAGAPKKEESKKGAKAKGVKVATKKIEKGKSSSEAAKDQKVKGQPASKVVKKGKAAITPRKGAKANKKK